MMIHPQKEDEQRWQLIKAADTVGAYLKCLEEIVAGNREFNGAKISIEEKIRSFAMDEVDYFMRHFATSFSLTLDELGI